MHRIQQLILLSLALITGSFTAAHAAYVMPAQSRPEAHEKEFRTYLEKLNEQVKSDAPHNFCVANMVILGATNDELCTEAWLRRAAEAGNPAAMYKLAMQLTESSTSPEFFYLKGEESSRTMSSHSRSPQMQEAIKWLRTSAEKNFPPALLAYSSLLNEGRAGLRKNEKEANKLLMQAMKSGDFTSRALYLEQTGRLSTFADKDRREVQGEIKRGNHHVLYMLSGKAPDNKTMLEYLSQAASKGNGAALFALSEVTKAARINPKQSAAQLKAAVARREPDALYRYGLYMLEAPDDFTRAAGIAHNPAMGLALIRSAAMLGLHQAHLTLARAYFNGDYGIKPNAARSYAHILQVTQQRRDPIMLAAQAAQLLTGQGVEQDTATALRYLKFSADAGYSYAQVLTAYAHYKGLGTAQNTSTAIELLQEAAATGYPQAYVIIAYLHAKGLHGSKADAATAQRYIRLADINMNGEARSFFDWMMKKNDWVATPFPPIKQKS